MNTFNRILEEGTPAEAQAFLEDMVDKNMDYKDEVRAWIADWYPIEAINTTTYNPKKFLGALFVLMCALAAIIYTFIF